MSRPSRWPAVLVLAAVAAPVAAAAAQHSELAVSPFVSFLPSAGTSPLAGLALTFGGSGAFALRGSANLALDNSNNGTPSNPNRVRPWGADADAMFFFGHDRSDLRSITPFVFAGLGTKTADDVFADTHTKHNWSYGAGASIPIGGSVDFFGEGRWRMSRYVLPTSSMAPTPTTELRFGVSFHVGSSGSPDDGRRRAHQVTTHSSSF